MKTAAGNGEERSISYQASAWFVELEDAPDDAALRTAFETWLREDPRHGSAWRKTLDMSGIVDRAYLTGNDRHVTSGGSNDARAATHWRTAVRIAVAAAAAWLFLPNIVTTLRADELTGTAEVRTVTLADGSRIVLAPQSSVAVTMKRDRRTVRLLQGEAWFDVIHDPHRPFLVAAGTASVRVLGTAFDVRTSGVQTDVAVERGAVAASLPGEPDIPVRIIKVGQSVSLGVNGDATFHDIQPRHVAAWRHARGVFVDRPLGEVIGALRPWYRGHLVALGAGLERERVTGVYDLGDPDAALAALAKAHRMEIRKVTPWLRIVTVS